MSKIKINTNIYTENEISEYGPKIRKRYYHLNIKGLAEPLVKYSLCWGVIYPMLLCIIFMFYQPFIYSNIANLASS